MTLLWRKYELLRIRWRIIEGITPVDPEVKPQSLAWLDKEIEEINAEMGTTHLL